MATLIDIIEVNTKLIAQTNDLVDRHTSILEKLLDRVMVLEAEVAWLRRKDQKVKQ